MKTSRPLTSLKRSFQAAATVLTLGYATSASAIEWVDRIPDSGNGPIQFLADNGTVSFSSIFDIGAAGYNSSTHILTSFKVEFWFSDDNGDSSSEYVDIQLGLDRPGTANDTHTTIWNDLEVNGSHDNAPSSYHWIYQTFSSGVLLGDLSSDGLLNFKVKIQDFSTYKTEDTYLKIAQLTAFGTTRTTTTTTTVPDGGATLGLMGLGLMGLGALRRKLR